MFFRWEPNISPKQISNDKCRKLILGGNSDPGEDAITTALRETHEELGLQDVDVWCALPEVGGKDGTVLSQI